MYATKKSYLTVPILIVCVLLLAGVGQAAEIFLSPDTTLLQGGTGTEIDIELQVDAATTNLRAFQIFLSIDRSRIDTAWIISGPDTIDAVTEGPLLGTSGKVTYFNYVVENGDTILTVEGTILGYPGFVDGPGVLANLHMIVKDTGAIHLEVLRHELRDNDNNEIPSTAGGAVILNDVAPQEFDLLLPGDGATETLYLDDTLELVWESSESYYPGENVTYTLQYAPTSSFLPGNTTSISALTDTVYKIPVEDLDEGDFFWRVYAKGDVINKSQKSNPFPSVVAIEYGAVAPDGFDLLFPADGIVSDLTGLDNVFFQWESSTSGVPNIDSVWYVWAIGSPPLTEGTALFRDSALNLTDINVDTSLLPIDSNEYVWSVWAKNTRGLSTQALSTRSIRLWRVTTCCKFGTTGNVDYDPAGTIDISDLTRLVNFLFVTFEPLECEDEANTDGDLEGNVDISDLTTLVNFLFVTFEPLAPCP
jgi:hypothetical protein